LLLTSTFSMKKLLNVQEILKKSARVKIQCVPGFSNFHFHQPYNF
jgi:hypothetical protein